MKRRHFIALALFTLLSVAIVAWRYWWMTRRALIRLKLMKAPANLLRNADFSQCTNQNIPDYWGTLDAAVLKDFSTVLQIENGAPLTYARALRIHNPQANLEITLHSCGTFLPKPNPYTFSIYLRSDVDNFAVSLSMGWGGKHAVVVNQNWQRYAIVYTPHIEGELHQGFQVRVSLTEEGTLWLAAPQLELGEQGTAFVTALMDDHPLPIFAMPKADELSLIPAQVFAREEKGLMIDSAAQQIQINHPHRSFMKGGKPFLVFGIALYEPKEWQLDDIARQGFNAVALFFPAVKENGDAEKTIAGILALLDTLHRKGLLAIPLITHEPGTSLQAMIQEKVRFMNLCKHHPTILCWWMLDEPTQHLAYDVETDGLAFYQTAKAADPSRTAFINENVWREGDWLHRFLQATDIISVDLYPIGHFQNPLSAIAERVSAMNRESLQTGKPTAFWVQLYGNYDAPREPTPDELRAMTYLVFIRGVRLIFYWLYKPMNQMLWDSLKPLFEELNQLSAIITQDHSRWQSVGTVQLLVHYALWEVGEKFFLLACNISSDSIEAKFNLEQIAGKSFSAQQSWYEGKTHQFTGNRLVIELSPYGRQVITLW